MARRLTVHRTGAASYQGRTNGMKPLAYADAKRTAGIAHATPLRCHARWCQPRYVESLPDERKCDV